MFWCLSCGESPSQQSTWESPSQPSPWFNFYLFIYFIYSFVQNIGKKMTLTQFIENLVGLCDGKEFPKEILKVCS